MNPHEIEELNFGSGPRLWDATPEVCCAAFQLGACSHTEGYDRDDSEDGWAWFDEGDGNASMVFVGVERARAIRDAEIKAARETFERGRVDVAFVVDEPF